MVQGVSCLRFVESSGKMGVVSGSFVADNIMKVVKRGVYLAMQQHSNDDHLSDLILHIHPPLRRRLRMAAAHSHLSEEEYVGRLLEHVVPPESESRQQRSGHLNRTAVEELKHYREEIRRAHPGQVFEDSVELLRQAREERTRELEQR